MDQHYNTRTAASNHWSQQTHQLIARMKRRSSMSMFDDVWCPYSPPSSPQDGSINNWMTGWGKHICLLHILGRCLPYSSTPNRNRWVYCQVVWSIPASLWTIGQVAVYIRAANQSKKSWRKASQSGLAWTTSRGSSGSWRESRQLIKTSTAKICDLWQRDLVAERLLFWT